MNPVDKFYVIVLSTLVPPVGYITYLIYSKKHEVFELYKLLLLIVVPFVAFFLSTIIPVDLIPETFLFIIISLFLNIAVVIVGK